MIKNYLFLLFALVITALGCSDRTSKSADNTPVANTESKVQVNPLLADTVAVKKWIVGVIEEFFDEHELPSAERMKKYFTDDYSNYKQDALNLEYDNGDSTLTEEAFKKKWQHKYDIRYVGSGGYFIDAQDYGKIKVVLCQLIKHIGKDASLYNVIIRDLDFKTNYHRKFKIIVQDNKLRIDDIIELSK